jgi:hypothetical protein
MDIDEQRLKDIYQAGAQSERPASREKCPPPETLLGLMRSRLSPGKASKVIDHISRCGHCAGEFRFLLGTLREEKPLLQETERCLTANRPDEAREPAFRGAKALIRRWGLDIRRLSWGSLSLFVGLAVTGLAVAAFLVFRSPATVRSNAPAAVRLIQPVDQKVSKSSLVFRWEPMSGSEYYTFELFDRALEPVWKSDRVGAVKIVLPQEVGRKLTPGDIFFWMVTAHLPDGEKRTSRPEKFTIEERSPQVQ